MECIIFIGIQASGKSTFYREKFFRTHVRINLDMLRTRRRENLLIEACLAGKQRFVVDNTNVSRERRADYIARAKANNFLVKGYFFATSLEKALERNMQRVGKERIPEIGVRHMWSMLERPQLSEGFDEIHIVYMRPGASQRFRIVPYTTEAVTP